MSYCENHYRSLVSMLFAVENMYATTKSRSEELACKQAEGAIRAKLKEHIQFCQDALESRAELIMQSSSPPSGSMPEVPFS